MEKYDLKHKVIIRKANPENHYNGYYEVPYKQYNENGDLVTDGTEDFSSDRLKTISSYEILEYTGSRTKS